MIKLATIHCCFYKSEKILNVEYKSELAMLISPIYQFKWLVNSEISVCSSYCDSLNNGQESEIYNSISGHYCYQNLKLEF